MVNAARMRMPEQIRAAPDKKDASLPDEFSEVVVEMATNLSTSGEKRGCDWSLESSFIRKYHPLLVSGIGYRGG